MTYDIRLATTDDGEVLARFSAESFGYPVAQQPFPDPQADGRTTYVTTAGDRIVASTRVREYESWFWGARIPTAGIASVKVMPEHRGKGLLTPLFERSLRDAVEQGAAISTLFATAPGIYRRLGYETFACYDEETAIPTAALAQVRAPAGTLTRATVDDIPAMRRIYDEWARAHNGPLTRDGASFPASDARLAEALPEVTIAHDADGTASGYAIWQRTGGYERDGVLEVHDLVALTDCGMRQLLAMLGTFATVAPTTMLSSSQPDLAQIVLPADAWRVRKPCPYGLAVLDVERALTLRRYPEWLDLDLPFAVSGMFLPGQDGSYRLRVREGRPEVSRIDEASTTYAARGFALRFAGTHSQVDLRRAGLLTGAAEDNSRWDVAFSGRQAHIRDYF